jgi:hypothetical protein
MPSSRATVAPEKTKATQIGLRGLTYLTNVKDRPVETIVTKGLGLKPPLKEDQIEWATRA